MESASVAQPAGAGGGKGLKANAIGYISNVVIGVASTAPGYSIAATLGFVVAVAGVGLQAPAVMLLAFVPMFCVAYAYRYMNQADPDCGTSFSGGHARPRPVVRLADRLGDRGHRLTRSRSSSALGRRWSSASGRCCSARC